MFSYAAGTYDPAILELFQRLLAAFHGQHLSKCTPVHLAKVCIALQAAGQAQDKVRPALTSTLEKVNFRDQVMLWA